MAGAVVDSATQTSDAGSDQEDEYDHPLGNASPRVVIDTSAPFGSVEEAVIRFGGRGFWIPQRYLPHDHAPHEEPEESEIHHLEEQAAAMLKALQTKERETLEILKELELTKRLVEELKLKLPKEVSESISFPCLGFDRQMSTPHREGTERIPLSVNKDNNIKPDEHSYPATETGLIMMELKQAKLNLCQSTNDLAAIRASVESLSRKLEKEKNLVENTRDTQTTVHETKARSDAETVGGSVIPLVISRELRELNYEAEQFMKTAEAARSEVLKAMSDIEQTKTGLKVIEMRWLAAKKLEEAARAAESLALAEIRSLSNSDNMIAEGYHQKPGRISLSIEEYSALADRARKAEKLFKRRESDYLGRIAEDSEEKLNKTALNRRKLSAEEPIRRFVSEYNNSDFRNSFQSGPRRDPRLLDANEFDFVRSESKPVLRPTTSIGDILSRKLVLRDDLDIGRRQGQDVPDRHRVSLNQMLRQHRGDNSPLQAREKDNGGGSKNFFKRKGLRFVHISLSKPNKNKVQALNFW